jgi:hypothetical protein
MAAEEEEEALLKACKDGSYETVLQILNREAVDINCQDDDLFVVRLGQDMVKVLHPSRCY